MSLINLDALPRTTSYDPASADSAGRTSASLPAFGAYLQHAQTQPAASWGGSARDDGTAAQPNSDKEAPSRDAQSNRGADATTDATRSPSADRDSRRTQLDSTPQAKPADAQRPPSGSQPATPPAGASPAANAPAQPSADGGSQAGGKPSGSDDATPTSDGTKHDDKEKQGNAATVVSDVNANLIAAANAAAAGVAATNTAKTAPAQVKGVVSHAAPASGMAPAAAQANTAAGGGAHASDEHSAAPAGTMVDRPSAASVDSTGSPPTAQAVAATAANAAAAVTAPAAATASVAATATATSSAAANTGAVPPSIPADAKPATTAVAGAAAAQASSAGEPPEDAQAARLQRAKSAADALSASGTPGDDNSGPSANGGTNSASPPPTAASPTGAVQTANGMSTNRAAETQLSQADRVRLVQRVEQAFHDLSSQGGSVRLRLSPPDLGSLRIEIKVSKGEMTARVEADTPSARNLLLDNLPSLRDRLAQHDIKVQRFDVDLMDRSGSGAANQSWQQQTPSRQNPNAAVVRTAARTPASAATAAEASPSRAAAPEGRLNVVV